MYKFNKLILISFLIKSGFFVSLRTLSLACHSEGAKRLKNLLFQSLILLVIFSTNIFAIEKPTRFYDKQISIYGKIIQLTDYPKLILGIETSGQIVLEIYGENIKELETYKDNYMQIDGFLLGSSIFSKYSFEPISWNKITLKQLEDIENNINKQFTNIRWKSTKTQKWYRITKKLDILLRNSGIEDINIIFVEMDIFGLPKGERKRWYIGKHADILPSRVISGNNDFTINWDCEKLDFTDDEQMKYDLKLGFTNKNNILGIYKFSSHNKWGESWGSTNIQ
ncbi:MAG: hypothetical protein HY934_07065 [Candidatus Firestonebacteria bacterium]|nr:hypothetical protein [Candidatus Firestonebacteria bacterium]